MQKLLLVSVLVSAMAGTAVAGRAKAKWCHGDTRMSSVRLDQYKEGDVEKGLTSVVAGMCNTDQTQDNEWAGIDDAFKKLSARFGLSDDDWSDVVDWANRKGGYNPGMAQLDQKKVWSKYDAVEQYSGLEGNHVAVGNKMGAVDPMYFIDALGANLTETGRMHWIDWCIGQQGKSQAVVWALCQPDIDAFDPKKVAGELRAANDHPGYDRMVIRLTLDDVVQKLPKHAAEVKALLAKDPIYGEMFDIAKKERTAWKPSADLVAMNAALEEAMVSKSRKATAGCGETTLKAVLSSISKIPAKTFALHRKEDENAMVFFGKMTDVISSGLMSEPDAFLAANAFGMCWAMTEKPDDDQLIIESFARDGGSEWAGFRGPRTAAQTRIFQANLQPDDRDAKIEFPQIEREWFPERTGNSWRGSNGVLTKVSSNGGKVHIEFQQKKHQEYVSLNCKKTGRIQAIRGNGDVVYEETCSDSKLITSMEGPGPQDIPAEQGKGLKAGMFVNIVAGYVLTAWPAKSDTPSVILGQPVK